MIIQPLTHAKYASRTLKKGVRYSPPPASLDPRKLDRAKLDEIIGESDSDIIRTVASRLNVGRVYGLYMFKGGSIRRSFCLFTG